MPYGKHILEGCGLFQGKFPVHAGSLYHKAGCSLCVKICT